VTSPARRRARPASACASCRCSSGWTWTSAIGGHSGQLVLAVPRGVVGGSLELTAQEMVRIKTSRGPDALACFSSAKCSMKRTT